MTFARWLTALGVLSLLTSNVPAIPVSAQQEHADWARELYNMGADWLRTSAPTDLWGDYELMSFDEVLDYFAEVQNALQGESYDILSDWYPYVKNALDFARGFPALAPYVTWLEQRLDYFEVAHIVVSRVPARVPVPSTPPAPAPKPREPLVRPSPRPPPVIPPALQKQRDDVASDSGMWKARLREKPVPRGAQIWVPRLKSVFRREGVPEELVWIAEVESSFNPEARSPAGAVGLFQFMPATAERFGLSLQPRDERLDPELSAQAAARYLKTLYQQFRDWPLCFAAYNAGEGRVRRLLQNASEKSFSAIEPALPVETRMYVPKVLAAISVREGKEVHELPAPGGLRARSKGQNSRKVATLNLSVRTREDPTDPIVTEEVNGLHTLWAWCGRP